MDRKGYSRVELTDILPSTSESEGCDADWRPPRAPSRVINLLIKSMFLPDEIVRIVEETIGWTFLHFDSSEEESVDQVLQLSPANLKPLRRMVRALRDIRSKTWTPDIPYLKQNLPKFKTLLGSLLDELKNCREVRSPRNAQPLLILPMRNPNHLPEPDPHDLSRHAGALEALLEDLEAQPNNAVMLLPQLDEHIKTVHQLIEFLS